MKNLFAFLTLAATLFCGDAAFAQSPPFNSTSVGTLGGNCTQQGAVLFQSASGQSKCLPAGTSGYTLRANGAGSDLTWSLVTGTGTVTSVGATVPSWLTVTGSPVTAAGTLAITGTSEPANQVLASPNGSAGAMTPRALVGADLPLPSTSTLGGTESLTCSAGQFWSALATTGVPTCSALASSALTPVLGSTRGAVAEYGASGWTAINPSATSGTVLTSAGTGADPTYTSVVNSVANSTQVNFSATTGAGVSASLNYETLGYRNRLVNGDFRISQTLPSGSSTTSSVGCTTPCNPLVEPWIMNATGVAFSGTYYTNSSAVPGFNSYVILTGANSNTSAYIAQRIPATDAYDLASTNVTISATLYCNSGLTIGWSLYYPGSTDNYASETLITSGIWTATGTATRYSAVAAVSTSAVNGLELRLSPGNGAAFGAASQCTFTGIQLEPGSYLTAFERLPFPAQLSRAQRFYECSYDYGTALGTITNNGISDLQAGSFASATFTINLPSVFKTSKRADPVITYYSPTTGTSGKARDFVNSADITPASTIAGTSGILTTLTASAANTSYGLGLHWCANAGL